MPRTTKRKPAASPAPAPERVSVGSTGLSVPEDRARAIAAAHLAGVPIKRICEEFGTSHHTIAGIIRNRPELLDQARDITARNWKTLAALGTASLIDRLPEMKDHALTVMSAIATEKAELLAGGATQRIEHVQAPSADEWMDVVDGVIVESSPVMGNAGRTRAPKAPAPRQPAALPAPDGEQPSVSCSVSSVDAAGVPTFEPDEARFLPPPPPSDGGGAGVRPSSRSSYPDSTDDEKFFTKR